MSDTVDIYNQEQITAALGGIQSAINALQLQLDYERAKIVAALGGEPVLMQDGEVPTSTYFAGGLGADSAYVDGDAHIEGKLHVGLGPTAGDGSQALQVDGSIVVGDGAGGELSQLTDDGGVSLYSGKYVTYQAGTTNVAAGDVLFRVTANTIRRVALLDFAFVSYSALALRAVIRIEVGSLIGSGVVTVTNLQSTGAQLRYATSNNGTNAFFDFYLQNTTPVDINAGDANNIVITTIPTRYGGVTVTFPNH